MSTDRRRGACPTLSSPMATGDGLLARLNPIGGAISPQDLGAVAETAASFGNGMLEITQRGSLQIRGLKPDTVAGMNAAVANLSVGVRDGLPIDISPLAGLDPDEIADPRPLADAIEQGAETFRAQLGPKVSVVIDGGGHSMLGGVKSDVRLTAVTPDRWMVALAGDAMAATPVGEYDRPTAIDRAIGLLGEIASCGRTGRGRDLQRTHSKGSAPKAPQVLTPGTVLSLSARIAAVVSPAFGTMTSDQLRGFTQQLIDLGIAELRLSPERLLILLCANPQTATGAIACADRAGFITTPEDPRLRIVACAGKPACASGFYDTRALGDWLAKSEPALRDAPFRLHLSGCDKGCAQPSGARVDLIGTRQGLTIVANGIALPAELRQRLLPEPMQHAS